MNHSDDAALVTVLFTDIVGSTEIAAAMGDRRWRTLLDRHHRIVRAQLRRFGGREVDTAGDGFLATFDRPGSAVRCAFAICEQVRTVGLEIRAGLHVGEVTRRRRQVSGIAIHTGARISALAGPSEILVSGTIRDLLPGGGFAFEDRGVHDLKGVPGRHHVAAVTEIDGRGLSGVLDRREAERRRIAVTGPSPDRRPARIAAACVAALVLVAGITVLLTRGEEIPAPVTAAPSAVIRIDPETNRAAEVFPVPARHVPGVGSRIAVGEGGIWVSSALVLARVDPSTGGAERVHLSGEALRLAVGHRAVWAAGQSAVAVINAATLEELRVVPVTEGQQFVTPIDTSSEAVWVGGDSLGRIDPIPPYDVDHFEVAQSVDELASGPDGIWIVDQLSKTLALFDPRRGEVTRQIALQSQADALDVSPDGTVWVLTASAGTLSRVTPSGVEEAIQVGTNPIDLVATADAVWVADADGGQVIRVDPLTAAVTPIPVSGEIAAIAADGASVWVLRV